VNGDGKPDLVCANKNGNTLSVLTNNGTGGFVTASTLSVGLNPSFVIAADVNGDGKPDLIAADTGSNTLTILTNNGSGGFVLASSPTVGNTPACICVADVNGDGNVDLISANDITSGTLTVLTNATQIPVAPTITNQPASQTNHVGGTASFTVGAQSGGASSVGYQWQFDGTNLPAATTNVLTLTNLALNQAGTYDIIVKTAYGSVTSSPAILNVQFLLVNVNGQPAVGTASAVGSAQVTFSGGYGNGFVFYTLDGSTPDYGSALYTGPFTLTNSAVVQGLDLSADFSQDFLASAVSVQIVSQFNLQTSAVGQGTVSVNPTNNPYASNSVVLLTASAATNWAFDYWTGNATGNQNPLSVTMNGPRSIQAVFVQTNFPLSVSAPGGGSVTANGQTILQGTYYPAGTVVALAAVASNGWSFLGWQGSASGTNNPLNLTINQTNNIQAIFGTTLAVNPVGGGGVVLSQPNPIPFGTTVTVSAVPNFGEYFVLWGGSVSGTNSPAVITVTNASPTADALFATLPDGKCALSVVINGSGTVTMNPHQEYYNPGATVTLTATTTNVGSPFYGWTQGAEGTTNPLAVTITTNTVIQANFTGFPTVIVSPQNLIVQAGSNAVLTASAMGFAPLTYQWQDSGGLIAGATNPSYLISDVQATNTDSYSVIVSNPLGAVTSSVAKVTVVYPPSISAQPASQIVAAGESATLSVTATGTTPLSYQWGNSAGAILGATNANYTLNPAGTNNRDNYTVIVSNAYGVATSVVAELVVYLPVTIISQPANQIVPLLGTATFSVAAGGWPTPTYQWTFNGTNLLDGTSPTLIVTNVGLTNLGNYAVAVGNGYSTQASVPASLCMLPSIITPCAGAAAIWGGSATLSVGAVGTGPLSYQWYKNGGAVANATNAGFTLSNIQFTNGGLYSVVVTSPLGSVTNAPALLVVSTAGVSISLCPGGCPGISVNGIVGQNYVIESTADLSDPNSWVVMTNLTLTQAVNTWVDTNTDVSLPENSQQFYQILPGQ
jgi:hypothetical protein